MQGINKLNITWKDDNHAHIQDPDNGNEFDITIRPRKMWQGNKAVKPRLYVSGSLVREEDEFLTHRGAVKETKAAFLPTLAKIINRDVEINFSAKAGCSCGCSPGFIVNDNSIPFDIWMNSK